MRSSLPRKIGGECARVRRLGFSVWIRSSRTRERKQNSEKERDGVLVQRRVWRLHVRHQAAGGQQYSRSSFAVILPCATPVGMPIPLYLHPASKHPPDTDPSINNSDKTSRERTSSLSVDSKRSRTNSESAHRSACRSPGPTPHHLHIQHHDTETKPSQQYQ